MQKISPQGTGAGRPVSERYWMVRKNDGGDWVWWNDRDEDWVDRDDATREGTKTDGRLARDRARAHDVRLVLDDTEPRTTAAFDAVRLVRVTSKRSRDVKDLERNLSGVHEMAKIVLQHTKDLVEHVRALVALSSPKQ